MVTLHSRVRVLADVHVASEKNPSFERNKHLFVTVHQGPRTEAAWRPGTHSGGCSVGEMGCSRPALPILTALALSTMGGKQSGVETKEQPPPEFSVPLMIPGRTRQVLMSASIFSTGGKCPLQQEDSTLDFPFCVSQHAEHW